MADQCEARSTAEVELYDIVVDSKAASVCRYCVLTRLSVPNVRARRALTQQTNSVSEFERSIINEPWPGVYCEIAYGPRSVPDTIPAPAPVEPAKCRDCESPATHDRRCVYCNARDSRDEFETMMATDRESGHDARARLAAFEKREKPRKTRDSVELARKHPWCCGGEDEP